MLASTFLALLGLSVLGWIAFNLAVYALPFAIGLTSGFYVYETGNGVFLSILVGVLFGGIAVVLGDAAFERVRFPFLRIVIGLIYAVPAGITGFHAAKGLSSFGGTGDLTITLLSWLGALIIGGTAWARMSCRSEVGPFDRHAPTQLRAADDWAD
ncbi:hypothetical protein [Gymnodinialimonas hymeniacidonis]|uniref:hypothetical protein n=1 Tax=Gymnodinialimonas hymeniacidonis TaxID=3126508 RepID=UPI0034C659B9